MNRLYVEKKNKRVIDFLEGMGEGWVAESKTGRYIYHIDDHELFKIAYRMVWGIER